MAYTLSRSELENLLEQCEARQATYPFDHPQYNKIGEQIEDLKDRIEKSK